MVLGLFKKKKKEGESKSQVDEKEYSEEKYVIDRLEEIYRYIKSGDVSKIKEIFPEADGFSRGSYNYIGLDWKSGDKKFLIFMKSLSKSF